MKKELTKEQARREINNKIKKLEKENESIQKQVSALERKSRAIWSKKDEIVSPFVKFSKFKEGDMFIFKPATNLIIREVKASINYSDTVVIRYHLTSNKNTDNNRFEESELIDYIKKGRVVQVHKKEIKRDKNPNTLMVTSIQGRRKEFYELEGVRRKKGESKKHGWRYLFETVDDKKNKYYINVLFKYTPSFLDPNYPFSEKEIPYKMQFKKKVILDGRVIYNFYVKRYSSRYEYIENKHTNYPEHLAYEVEFVDEKDVFETLIEFS